MTGREGREGADAVGAGEPPLLIEPVVAWPRQAETDCDYLVTVDLRGPLPEHEGAEPGWPGAEEELAFTVTLEGSPFFVCAALDEPSVVLHRFGGTYGPARFCVSTGRETGTASLWLTVSNQWGVPVRKAELRSEIRAREPGGTPTARPAAEHPAPPSPLAPAPSARGTRRDFRSALSRLLGRETEAGERVRAEGPVPVERPQREAPDAGGAGEESQFREARRAQEDREAQEAREAREVRRERNPRAGQDGRPTVTISFAGFNRAWAAWIGDRLERRGLRVVHLRWDAPSDRSLTSLLSDLALAEGRILIVVSEWYFQLGPRTHEEWNAALREVVAPDPARFAAVSVTHASVPSATAVLAPVDLTNMGADEAERRLLDRLDLRTGALPEPAGSARGPRFPAAMPDVWGGVPRRNRRFTGREALLTDAYHLLQDSEPGAGVLTLHGMSGVGKTQLAAEYVYRFGSEYDVVWWVGAESRVTYRRLLAELAPQLGLSTGAEYGERLRAVRDALRRGDPYARWLLILDGADDPEQIWDLVPAGPGHVLITSRNPEWGEHNSKLLEVPAYGREESVAFIRRRAPRLSEEEADLLAGVLEDLPLLLDQTAGWLNDSDLTVREYLALLEGRTGQDVVKVSADFPLAFQTAWSILLNKLRETVPESVDLLRLCTFFAPGHIPVRLLREMPRDAVPERLSPLFGDPLRWNNAINQLRQYSIVRLEAQESASGEAAYSGGTLYLHRMVHQIVRQDMPEQDRQEIIEVVRRALAAADPGRPTDPGAWASYAEIVPHLRYADMMRSTDPGAQDLVLNCLRYLWFAGEYAEGIELGRHTLELWQDLLGESHPQIWELTYRYANLLRSAGHYARTEAFERAAVEHLREERGPADLVHLRAASGLAADLWGLGRYDEARELCAWLHTTYRDVLGDQDARTLNALNNLGFSLRLLGRYDEARRIDRRTMEERRLLLGPRHPWTLFSETSYAVNLRMLGHYFEASSVQERTVRECRRVLGHRNPQTLRAELNLALCQYRSGDRRSAGALLAQVREGYDRKLGEMHLETLGAVVSQSCFAREHGDIDQAHETSESLLARYRVVLPEAHPFVIGAQANHALILRAVGEREHAHVLIEQALAGMASALGDTHPHTLGCAVNASGLRNLVGDVEAAAELSEVTARRAAESLGGTHPLTLSARVAHAADLRSLRDRDRAYQVETEALADLDATLGHQHPHTVSARRRNRPYWDFEPQTT